VETASPRRGDQSVWSLGQGSLGVVPRVGGPVLGRTEIRGGMGQDKGGDGGDGEERKGEDQGGGEVEKGERCVILMVFLISQSSTQTRAYEDALESVSWLQSALCFHIPCRHLIVVRVKHPSCSSVGVA
jgi:hypothetical protein